MLGKLVKLSAIICLLLIGCSVFFYFFFFLPGKERQYLKTLETERQEKVSNEAKRVGFITDCMTAAGEEYKEFWNNECERLGKKDECPLPEQIYSRLDQTQKERVDLCYKLYPEK